MRAAEPLETQLCTFEFEIAIEKLKMLQINGIRKVSSRV
jgi:hypothetical protein